MDLKKQARAVGLKQSRKALQKGLARSLYVAKDADPMIQEEMMQLARQNSVPVEASFTMAQLGKAVGISVGAAVIALFE